MTWWATYPAARQVSLDAGDAVMSRMLGAVIGAAVGDALGAALEGARDIPSAAEVDKALEMCGGGMWTVAPGQVTDDTELTICLADALAAAGSAPAFPEAEVADRYGAWFVSRPFDCGISCKNAFSGASTA